MSENSDVTIVEASKKLGLTRGKVLILIEKGELDSEEIGGIIWINRNSLMRLREKLLYDPNSINYDTNSLSGIADKPKQSSIHRRLFIGLGIAGASAVGAVAGGILTNATNDLYSFSIKKHWKSFFDPDFVSESRKEAIRRVLSFGAEYSIYGGTNLPNLKGAHPDNVAAAAAIEKALRRSDEVKSVITPENNCEMSLDIDYNVLVAGGPVGDLKTRIAFEFEGPHERRLIRRKNPIVDLRWWGVADRESEESKSAGGKVGYRLEGVGWRTTEYWPLFDAREGDYLPVQLGAEQPGGHQTDRVYWLKDNMVSVTRLPNFFSGNAEIMLSEELPLVNWPALAIIDGRNGLGTRGLELLVEEAGDDALKDTESALNSLTKITPFYQILYSVDNLDNSRGYSRFTSIQFRGFHPIYLSMNDAQKMVRYARDRWSAENC